MRSKHMVMTNEKINAMINEGYGQGEGAAYKPWLEVIKLSLFSQGNRIPDIHNGRVHQCLSSLEADYCRYLMWQDDVLDIREQYPLFQVKETEAIASELHVKHPAYPGTKLSTVMTTDFLVTKSIAGDRKLVARSVKYKNELDSKARTLEKQAIEANYWSARGIEWQIITEDSFSRLEARNIAKLFGTYNYPLENCMNVEQKAELSLKVVDNLLEKKDARVSDVCKEIDKDENLKLGTTLTLFLHLCANKQIPIILSTKFLPTNSVHETIDLIALQKLIRG